MRVVVIGGAGAMGRITVKDLFETGSSHDEIVIADYDLEKAQRLAESYQSPRVRAARIDARDIAGSARVLEGAFVAINTTQYQLNLEVMEAAIAAHCHYIDLGGLFHTTLKQLKLHERFKQIRKTALLGMGAAPGITNILARHGADQLDRVTEIHARVGSMDRTRYEPKPALAVSYSLKTILEEFSFEPAVFRKGKMVFVEPMSGDEPHVFPAPIGARRPMFTIHSEVATLPGSFADKGVREVSFKIAFDPEFVDRVRFLRDLGFASHDPIEVGGVKVAPVDVVNRIAMSQSPPRQVGKLRQYEVVRAVVKGTQGSRKATYIVDCHTSGMPKWGIGLDIDTGSPPAIAAQMLAEGSINETGAVPAEIAVPPKAFFGHLKKRGMKVKVQRKPGWGFKV